MLKLSPPPFPTRFDSDEQAAIGADQDQNSNEIEAVAWPTEHNGHGVNSGQSEIKAGTKFNVIRNEREQYIDSLERKLAKFHERGPTSNPDSGYGSAKRAAVNVQLEEHHDEERDCPTMSDDNAYGSSEDESKREGRPLLGSASEDDAGQDEGTLPGQNHTPQDSPTRQVNVIPATPGDHDDLPTAGDTLSGNRRISFSNSVRIGGGIRTSSRPHRHRRPPAPVLVDVFGAGTTVPPPRTTHRSASLVSYTSSGQNSRSESPSRPHGRLLRDISGASLLQEQPMNATAYSLYSSSPGSQFPSRSSSPCSSIYAPLQASKAHCPTPMSVQPPRRPRSATLTFREYLDSRDGNESDEEVVRGYHELVAEQRLKRERWERRHRQRANDVRQLRRERVSLSEVENGHGNGARAHGFWSRVAELLALGAAGASGSARGTITVNYGATNTSQRTGGPRPIQPRPKRVQSRLSISSDVDSDEISEEDESLLDEEEDLVSQHKKRRQQQRRGRARGRERVKTEVDVRFGTAPRRWFSWLWWMYQIGRFPLCSIGCFGRKRAHERPHQERSRDSRRSGDERANGGAYEAL